jgi:DNA-binding SARP family transcriptional activator/class 3 adenylate cyclase
VEFRILGPLEVRAAGHAVPVPGAKPRAVLAVLLLQANRPVSAERIAQALWGEEAPAAAANTVQVHVSRLRKALGDGAPLVTTAAGYELRVGPGELDAGRLEAGLATGRAELAAGRPEASAEVLEAALAEWRGPPLADLADAPFADRERARLEELRVAAFEELVEARLALGRHAEVVGQLDALIAEHPYRERLRAQQMLALYRCDRQAEALQAYQDARRALVEELGIEPGERLRELERAVLAQDPALAAPAAARPAGAVRTSGPPHDGPDAGPSAPGGAAAGPARPQRRLVTVLCAGVAAVEHDPEVLDALLDRLEVVVARHGGSVENVSGDVVVGVFGLAELHEDDAQRAVRAARDLHAEDERLRLGIESGEVFVGGGSRRASGDVFTLAAALQAAADPGDTALGERARALLRDAERPARSPFVDREAEVAALRRVFAAVREERVCRPVSVIGPAGIGKSRLAQELAATLDATVVMGGCPSYGEGVTYRPLAEVVGTLGGREGVAELLGDGPAAQMVLAAAGLSDGQAQPEETFWAVRRLLEAAAAERPLVVVLEDLHWAEPTLLDLVDYLSVFSTGHAILLACVARPELLEARPTWAQPGHEVLVLDPLPEDHARTLVAAAGSLAPGAAERIVQTAEGNPLFLEQLVAFGAAPGELPTSIQALLAARLARLEPDERAVLEDASVQGRSFHADPRLVPEATAARLVALAQRRLIVPERSELPGHDAFRFGHALIREAAYRSLPRRRRAELHEAAARWLDEQPGTHDELAGHHLAEAHAARAALGEPDGALAAEAAQRLAAAADAALLRGDPPAGARLLERAASLREDGELLPALGAALFEAGRVADAARVLEEATDGARDPRQRARALVELELVRLETDPAAAGRVPDDEWAALEGDAHGECRVGLLRGRLAWDPGRVADADAAWAQAATRAERAGLRRDLFEIVAWRAAAAALGPEPAAAAIERLEGFRALAASSPIATASVLNPLAYLHAMRGDLARSEALLAEAGEILAELAGLGAGISHLEAFVRLLAGQPERAEALLADDVEVLSAMVEGSALATTKALLARAVLAQGRAREAAELAAEAGALTSPQDVLTQALWRGARAQALADEGRHAEALALAREAVAALEPTDLLSHRGDGMLDLAAVLSASGHREESEQAVRSAAALYARKGNVVAAARAQQLLTETRR